MRRLSWFVLPVALLAACTDPKDGKGGDTASGDDTGEGPGPDVQPGEKCGPIEGDVTWTSGVHQVTCDVKVLSGTLTIEAGSVVQFGDGRSLEVASGDFEAGIVMAGTADAPIVLEAVVNAGEATRWSGVTIHPNASTARFSHVEIVDGGDTRGAGLNIEGAEVEVDTLSITGAELCGLRLADGGRLAAGARGITVTESGGAAVCARVSEVHTLPAEGSTYTGNLYDQVSVTGGDLNASVTWLDLGVPYAILDSFTVENTAEAPALFTLETGVEMRMGERTELNFSRSGGASGLIAEGVTFTALGASVAGSWRGITFDHGTLEETSLVDVRIEYAGGDAQPGALVIEDALVHLQDVTVSDSEGVALRVEGSGQIAPGSGGLVLTASALPLSLVANAVGSLPADIDLSGNEEDVILLEGDGDVYLDATWGAFAWDYRVDTNVSVSGSADFPAHLTIDPGVTLRFDNDRRFSVGGTGAASLHAVGTADAPIRFLPHAAYADGAWGGVGFFGGTDGASTTLEHFEIGWGGGERMDAGLVIRETSPTIASGHVHDSNEWGITIRCSTTNPSDIFYGGNLVGDIEIDPSC